MEKRLLILVSAGLLLGLAASGEFLRRQSSKKLWPGKQLENATKLGFALSVHRQKHGFYPESLTDLTANGLLDEMEFEALRFKSSSAAKSENWLYHAPSNASHVAIVSPQPVYPWNGHAGLYVIARADGGGELISNAKRHLISAPEQR